MWIVDGGPLCIGPDDNHADSIGLEEVLFWGIVFLDSLCLLFLGSLFLGHLSLSLCWLSISHKLLDQS